MKIKTVNRSPRFLVLLCLFALLLAGCASSPATVTALPPTPTTAPATVPLVTPAVQLPAAKTTADLNGHDEIFQIIRQYILPAITDK